MSLTEAFLLAHDLGVPHQEMAQAAGDSGDAGTLVILAVVCVSAVVLAGLLALRRRLDGDPDSS